MIDLESLSKDELEKLQKDVKSALDSHDARRRKEAKAAAEKAVAEFGFTLQDLTEDGKKTKKSPVRYRNPDDLSQTWGGRGRKPKWLEAELSKGRKLEEFKL